MTSIPPSSSSSIKEKAAHDMDPEKADHQVPSNDESSPPNSDVAAAADGGDVEKPKGPPPGAFDPRENPDGGTKAWLCVLGGFCALFCSFGWINCVGVFQNYYQTHQLAAYSPSTVAWVTSLEIWCMFFFGPFIGKVFDNYGPRFLLAAGAFLEVFGLMMTSLSTEYYQFILAQGLCSSIGASMVFYPAMSTVTTWFFKKRATAFGIIASGSSLGGVILPIMVQRLIPEIGYPWAMRTTAFVLLFMLIIANLTITSRLTPKRTPFNAMEFVQPFREFGFVLVAAGCFCFFLGLFLPINYIILEAVATGMSEALAQYMVPILNALSLFGRILPGIVADKIGRYNTMVILDIFTGIITLALWIPASSNAATIVFAALFGFGSGAFVSLAPSLIAQISDVRKIGVRTGTLFATVSIAALISQPVGGAIIQRWDGSYMGLKIFAGVMMVGGTAILLAARIYLGGAKLTAKF